MTGYDYDDEGSALLIGLAAAALSGAFVGMVAGAIGASLAWMTWGTL